MTIKTNIEGFNKGFTLLEVLFCLSIMAILLLIALPNYSSYSAKTARAAAKLDLLNIASKLETYFLEHHTYKGVNTADLIKSLHSYPYFHLAIKSLSQNTYTLIAHANPKQQSLDKACPTLVLNHLGQKGVLDNLGHYNYSDPSACW
ncbi:MAG: hypothetical protein A3F18_06350 [Legionellales bacterium RIFCSPHIGHO2_12_FULL_37_14]|nr:MAG: hypothetical protein A3F18_06350 [Legionellales bacterium RIFCSPHIGHO2_12_FULL_37_14]